jgi:hypothetical protein
MTEQTQTWPTDLRVVLPREWWFIPLDDAQRRDAVIAAIVDKQYAGLDDQPLAKAEARKAMGNNALRATELGGRRMAYSLMSLAGLPLPATMTLYWHDLGAPYGADHLADLYSSFVTEQAEEAEDREQALAAGRPVPQGPDVALARAEVAAGPVLRRVTQATGGDDLGTGLPAYDDAATVPILLAEYWLLFPGGQGLAQLSFSTGLVAWSEQLLEFFDAVVGTASWVLPAH